MGSFARPNWTPQEITKLKELCDSGLYRFEEIAKQIGRPKTGIMYKCYEQGFNNLYRTPCIYSHNEDYFKDITFDTCYWAAILVTDGCLALRNGYHAIKWIVAVKDESLMKSFLKAINSNHPIKHRFTKCNLSTKDTEKLFESCWLSIETPGNLVKDLETNFGFTKEKTTRFSPPALPSLKHRLCFIRGYIDGDGWITSSKTSGGISISVCGINRDIITWIKQTLESMNLPTLRTKNTESLVYQQKKNGDKSHYWATKGMSAAILFEILRRLPTPNLSRKWDNPRILTILDYWKSRADVWPGEQFFVDFMTSLDSPTVTLPESRVLHIVSLCP